MALRTTTSSRGLAAAAPRPAVKPASSTSFAICAVTSVCSSGGIIWIGSIPGALFQERCRCASQRPGISVAPIPSMTVWPPAPGAGRKAGRAPRHLPDPIALDDDLAGVRILAGAVENAHVGENDAVRSADPVVRHAVSPPVCVAAHWRSRPYSATDAHARM